MLIVLYKSAIFFFPFIKELFLGKGKADSEYESDEIPKRRNVIKVILIVIAIISVVLNFILTDKLISLGSKLVIANRTIENMKKPIVVKQAPIVPVVVTPPVTFKQETHMTIKKKCNSDNGCVHKKVVPKNDKARERLTKIDEIR
jgi:NADH:ubiquinone oxidoreductase subunit 5 (subunit L)/multisubunit Na+/H+ antiporter MnhA subunit